MNHDVAIEPISLPRYQVPSMSFFDGSDQRDTTPPTITSQDTITSPVTTEFEYTISVTENSYAVNSQ